jgi:hypothetical protein
LRTTFPLRESLSFEPSTQVENASVDDLWSFVTEVLPGVALMLVGLLAALPSHRVLRQSNRGRARGAVSYLSGLGAGAVAAAVLATLCQHLGNSDAILQAGLFSAFFCPFLGMARALWSGPRKSSRRMTMARGSSH